MEEEKYGKQKNALGGEEESQLRKKVSLSISLSEVHDRIIVNRHWIPS